MSILASTDAAGTVPRGAYRPFVAPAHLKVASNSASCPQGPAQPRTSWATRGLTIAMAGANSSYRPPRPPSQMRSGGPSFRDRRQSTPGVLVNDQIREREVRVIDEDRETLGVFQTFEALAMAQEREVDLILVVPDASPPVCRLMDISKYNYELSKAAKDAKKKQRENITETKELKFRPGTDVHDYQTKLRAAQRFVSKSNKVKVSLQFRGREMDLIDQGHEMCKRIIEDLGSAIVVESPPSMQGRTMNMILGPRKDV
ncbi:CIF3 [Auxenochlorella protothecoides x Auxenochlorella symbiontica]